MENIKITPLDIFNNLFIRLKSRKIKDNILEIEYLISIGKGFEKWLQGEFILANIIHQNIELYPAIYKNKESGTSIRADAKGKGERIGDIGIEYNLGDKRGKKECDIFILESPFLKKYLCEDSWKIKDNSTEGKIRDLYNNKSKAHYIELKAKNYIEINKGLDNGLDSISELMSYDLNKLYNIFKKKHNLKEFLPRSVISICCFGFYNSQKEKLSEKDKESMIDVIIKNIVDNSYFENIKFVHEFINDYICLLMAYYDKFE
ncbi:MAG: hypothetical protein V1872_14595 [bacterium]